MSSVFVKVLVNDRFPKRSGDYHTDYGIAYFSHSKKKFYQENIVIDPEYWFEEVELPSDDEVVERLMHPTYISENISKKSIEIYKFSVRRGASYVLNKLKGGN